MKRNKNNLFKIVLIIMSILLVTATFGCQKGKLAEKPWTPGSPLDKDKVKIGVIYVDDAKKGYSYRHDLGIREMQRKLALKDEQIIRKLNVNGTDTIMLEHMMRECIKAGANIIVATSWEHQDICEKLATGYPNIIFAHTSGDKNNNSNYTNFFGRIYQARYLSGIVAGMKTRTNKIGFVAAMDKSNSEVTSGINAFALGVESVNPDAKVYVRVIYSWFDPAGERQATQKLLAEGCDVITQHCNTPVPQIEVEKAGLWGIGYNSDMSEDAPKAVLTSVIWNWDVYYTSLVESVINGSFTTKPYFGDLSGGMVDIIPPNEALVAPGTTDKIAEARERIIIGKFNVFDGVMETNDGRRIGAEGSTLSDREITGGINWYYRNVIELK